MPEASGTARKNRFRAASRVCHVSDSAISAGLTEGLVIGPAKDPARIPCLQGVLVRCACSRIVPGPQPPRALAGPEARGPSADAIQARAETRVRVPDIRSCAGDSAPGDPGPPTPAKGLADEPRRRRYLDQYIQSIHDSTIARAHAARNSRPRKSARDQARSGIQDFPSDRPRRPEPTRGRTS
jgi:hypothetical protein